MRSLVRSRFSPTLGISWILVLFLLYAVAASEEGAKTITSATTVESSSTDPTTELMSSASTSEESKSASTTDISIVAATTPIIRVSCSSIGENAAKDMFLTCHGADMQMLLIDGKYAKADFSSFTQQEFELMLKVKNPGGDHRMDGKRGFEGHFYARESEMVNITLSLILNAEPSSVTLENNMHLESVTLTGTLSGSYKIRINVSGNRKLASDSLKHLKEIKCLDSTASYIQDFGECNFDNLAIKTASELEGCHYIRGDLVINEHTSIDVLKEENLKNVTGCIIIANSILTNLTLISTIEKSGCSQSHRIVNNDHLCLHPEELGLTKAHFAKLGSGNLDYKNNMQDGCKGECTSAYLLKSKDKTCIIIKDNLEIKGIKEEDDTSYLDQIEEIHGSLYIKHTDLTNVTLLPSLTTIVFDKKPSGRAIFIQENERMEYFDLPKLTTVVLHKNRDVNSAAFVMERNGNYTMDKEQAERLSNITQTDIDKFPVPIVQEYGDGNYTVNGTAHRRRSRKNETEIEDEEKQGLSSSDLAGIIAGSVVGGIVVVGAIVILAIVFVRRRRLGKKKEREVKLHTDALVRIEVDDITSSTTTAVSSDDDKCDTVMDLPKTEQKGKLTVREAGHGPPDEWKRYFTKIEAIFKKQQRFNFDVTSIVGMEKIMIKRDGIDFKAASKLKLEEMKYTKKIWTHNPTFSLYGIRPRKEITKEIWYDHGDGFNPEVFIQECMKSSAVTLKYRTIMAALDYVMKNKRFGNPHDANAPPKQLIEVTGPIHVIGDTHGSLIDLQMIFSLDPENVAETHKIHPMLYYRYLFTGDYLDRGLYDTTLFAFLTVFATLHPTRIFLLRGNHEWFDETKMNGCTHHVRLNWPLEEAINVRNKILEVSCWLPIGARINGRAFAVHGGIGPMWKSIDGVDDLQKRFDTIPMPLCMSSIHPYKNEACFKGWPDDKIKEAVLAVENLLWSDPSSVFSQGNTRSVGSTFNENSVDEFTKQFGLDLIIRGHQDIGFYYSFGGKLVSIFGSFDGAGSISGVPYCFSSEKKFDKLKKNPSTAVLRITSTNTLHFLMMRHVYEGDDCTRAPCTERKRANNFTFDNPDEEWAAKIGGKVGNNKKNQKSGNTSAVRSVAKSAKSNKSAAKSAKSNHSVAKSAKANKSAAKSGKSNHSVAKSGKSAQSGMESAEGQKKKAPKKGTKSKNKAVAKPQKTKKSTTSGDKKSSSQ